MDARSVADIPEHELVPLLFDHDVLRGMLLGAGGAHKANEIHFMVPFSELAPESKELGDVDALVYEAGAPELAVAYEMKRVKVSLLIFSTGTPNKLGLISKAVLQANALQRLGFNRVVLAILLVTDGRERVDFNFAFRGASQELLRTVDAAIDLTRLHNDVGMFRIEVMQPVDRDITMSGGVTGKAYRIPKMRTQPASLTRQIIRYASRKMCSRDHR